MNWFERWHEIGRQGAKRQDEFIRKYYDHNTYIGIFRGLLTWGVAWYVLWHFYDIMDWFHDLTGGRQSDPVTPGQIRWVRLCASAMCGTGVLAEIVFLFKLSIIRYRAKRQRQETDADAQADNSDSQTPQE